MIQAFLKTLVVLVAWLVALDIVGVIACMIFDVVPLRGSSGALPYAIWFVLGAFAGFLAFATAGGWAAEAGEQDWMERPGGMAVGNRVLLSSLVILLGLAALFWRLYWSRGVAGEYFVPDSMPHSLTYFLSALAVFVAAPFILKPKPASTD